MKSTMMKKNNPADTAPLEAVTDCLVYALYGLTDGEMGKLLKELPVRLSKKFGNGFSLTN